MRVLAAALLAQAAFAADADGSHARSSCTSARGHAARARARAFRRHPPHAQRPPRHASPGTGAGRGAAQDAAVGGQRSAPGARRAWRASWSSSPPPRTATPPRASAWRSRRARCSRRSPIAWDSGSSSGSSRTWRSASCSPTTTGASPTALAEKRADRERYIARVVPHARSMLRAAGHRRPRSTGGRSTSTASIGRWSASS